LAEPFPERIEFVAPGRLLTETFGWQMGAWGGMLLVFAGSAFLQPGGASVLWVWGVGALGAALAGYESWRRRNPTSLALGPDAVGLYRGGALVERIGREGVTHCLLEGANTFKILFALGFCFLGSAALAFGTWVQPNDAWSRINATALAAAFASAWASSYRSRMRCEHFIVPRPSGRGEWVMFPREQGLLIINGEDARA